MMTEDADQPARRRFSFVETLEKNISARRGNPSQQRAGSFWACAKETPADGLLNKCESLLGFTRFQLRSLRTELDRRQLVFSGYDTRLGVL